MTKRYWTDDEAVEEANRRAEVYEEEKGVLISKVVLESHGIVLTGRRNYENN